MKIVKKRPPPQSFAFASYANAISYNLILYSKLPLFIIPPLFTWWIGAYLASPGNPFVADHWLESEMLLRRPRNPTKTSPRMEKRNAEKNRRETSGEHFPGPAAMMLLLFNKWPLKWPLMILQFKWLRVCHPKNKNKNNDSKVSI